MAILRAKILALSLGGLPLGGSKKHALAAEASYKVSALIRSNLCFLEGLGSFLEGFLEGAQKVIRSRLGYERVL
jgi:hypothetical protein